MSEYKIESVMIDPPKEWKGPHGVVWYKSVMLEGHDKAVSVGKKDPEVLKAGLILYGDIIETDYLEDKFKPSPPPANTGSSSGGYDDGRGDAITASMVVKLAFQAFIQSEGMLPQEEVHWHQVDYMADMLKKSIDKIKSDKVEPNTAPKPERYLRDIAEETRKTVETVKEVFPDDDPRYR